jgi:hypothetical protein
MQQAENCIFLSVCIICHITVTVERGTIFNLPENNQMLMSVGVHIILVSFGFIDKFSFLVIYHNFMACFYFFNKPTSKIHPGYL